MQVNSKPSTSTRKSSAPKSVGSVKRTSSQPKASTPSKPASPKDTFTASKENGKPNAAVPNFGSWAMAQPQAPQAAAKPSQADPAPRVAPQPPAPEVKSVEPSDAQPAPAAKIDPSGAKAFDDTSWAAAQARHTADFANQAGNLAKNQAVTKISSAALRPLNPAAGALGGAYFGKEAYDSFQKGNYGEATLQAANSGTLTATTAGVVKGGAAVAKVAGRAAPALGGALQAYQGVTSGDKWDMVSGGTKLAGAAMIATGFGAPVGSALIISSYMADFGRWGYNKLTQ